MSARRKKLKISSSFERDTSNLPHDIIQDILSRLPVKSLIRFKCVSKPWYSLISDSKFARTHLLQSKKNSDSGTLFVLTYSPYNFLNFTNFSFELERIEFPMKKYSQGTVLCSCDGLIILRSHFTKDKMFRTWNPSTRIYTKFSCPYEIEHYTRCGLCYDSSSYDYKFVMLISDFVYAVYSYKSKSWTKKDVTLEMIPPDTETDKQGAGHFVNGGAGLFVNGALHWVTSKSTKDFDPKKVEESCPIYECRYNSTYELLCFDPKDDYFKKMSTPACFEGNSVFYLTNLGGQLCLYRKTRDFNLLEIWMMKDYGDFNSWTKVLTIEDMTMKNSMQFATPLCLTNKSDLVFYNVNDSWTFNDPWNVNYSWITVYNPEKNTFREMHISDKRRTWDNMYLDPRLCWNSSLVLPK